jgi:hypothetical protein
MKQFSGYLFLLLGLAASAAPAQMVNRETYLREFERRAKFVTSIYDTMQAPGYAQIAVRYARGHDIAQADSVFIALLKAPRGDMFWMIPVIGAYLHGKDNMSSATAAAVRNAWKTYAPYRGDTENHWCMYYSALFLAAEQWPNLPASEWYNGKSSDENLQDAKGYLIHWIKITTTIGQGEFDSPDYFPEYATPMVLLSQYAQDPEMKLRGQMMADYLFADFAAEHLDGQYIGGFSRIYQPAVYEPLLSGASAFAYLYFGMGEATNSGWAVLPALSDYRLPDLIYRIAVDRSKNYVEKERKRVRNVIRYGKEMNPPVYKYSYITKDYGLGSLQGGILQPIQQHTWGVRYTYGRPYTTIFGLHPYWSGLELGMFFPEEVKTLIADVVASKGTYNNPDKWTSSSPFERTFQYKNTLIVLYDIAPGTTTEHIDGFFPRNLQERIVDPSGWILCKAGETYVGWYPLQEYEWKEEPGDPGRSSSVGSQSENEHIKETGCWRLRTHQLQNGYVVEVRSKDEVGSFDQFCAQLRTHIPQSSLKPGNVSVRYRTLGGDTMAFAFPEGRTLNGRTIDLSKTKLFDGPYMHAEVGSEKLTITYKNERRILDFKSIKITR